MYRTLRSLVVCALLSCAPSVPAARALPPTPPPAPTTEGDAACHREAPAQCTSPVPSLATDVRPILERRCFGCHTGDGPAADAHDFAKADGVIRHRRAILEEIATCSMPPKAPIPDAEAAVLLSWATCSQNER